MKHKRLMPFIFIAPFATNSALKDSHAFVMSTRKMNEELYQQELFYRRIEK
jgi:hypothetical protein